MEGWFEGPLGWFVVGWFSGEQGVSSWFERTVSVTGDWTERSVE